MTKIGVFDSGIGGFTVLWELQKSLPGARFVYLGDTANVPYGPKSPEQIRSLSRACAVRLADEKVDAIVVACNTASALALDEIRLSAPGIPVIGMVEPGAQAALEAISHPRAPILLLATRATVVSGAYRRALETLGYVQGLVEQACPLLVPMIEEGWVDHPILEATLAEYLVSVRGKAEPGVVLLGCTHYPWIEPVISKALPDWKVVQPAQRVARMLAEVLELNLRSLRRPKKKIAQAPSAESRFKWIFTDPVAVPAFAREWIREMASSPGSSSARSPNPE